MCSIACNLVETGLVRYMPLNRTLFSRFRNKRKLSLIKEIITTVLRSKMQISLDSGIVFKIILSHHSAIGPAAGVAEIRFLFS